MVTWQFFRFSTQLEELVLLEFRRIVYALSQLGAPGGGMHFGSLRLSSAAKKGRKMAVSSGRFCFISIAGGALACRGRHEDPQALLVRDIELPVSEHHARILGAVRQVPHLRLLQNSCVQHMDGKSPLQTGGDEQVRSVKVQPTGLVSCHLPENFLSISGDVKRLPVRGPAQRQNKAESKCIRRRFIYSRSA